MTPLLTDLRKLLPHTGLRPGSVVLLIALGVGTALSEAWSLTLVIPLLSADGRPTNGLLAPVYSFLDQWDPTSRMLWGAGLILGGIVLKNILGYLYTLLSQSLVASMSHRVRSAIVRSLLFVGQSWLDKREQGALINTLTRESWEVTSAIGYLFSILINVCIVVIFGTVLLAVSWKITLLAGLFFVGLSLLIQWITRRVRLLGNEAVNCNNRLTQRMVETLAAMRLIRSSGCETFEDARFQATSENVQRTFFQADRLSFLVHPVSEVMTALFLVLILLYGNASNDFGGTVAALLLLYRLHPRIKHIDQDRVGLASVAGAVAAVGEIIEVEEKGDLPTGTKTDFSIRDAITFEGVTFHYASSDQPALRNLSLSFPAGKTSALVGGSGAGKSTVAALLCRLYEPDAGRICVDGVPLVEIAISAWKNRIAFVGQEAFLFHASVAENIAYGKPGATQEEIRDAAAKAYAIEFIETMPAGMETIVGDRGVRLSGGQRQRLCLARALIRDPDILILDEATNALDAISEEAIRTALAEFSKGRTVIIIAHRLRTIRDSDHILVVSHGELAESGRYIDLMSKGGIFAEMEGIEMESKDENRDPA